MKSKIYLILVLWLCLLIIVFVVSASDGEDSGQSETKTADEPTTTTTEADDFLEDDSNNDVVLLQDKYVDYFAGETGNSYKFDVFTVFPEIELRPGRLCSVLLFDGEGDGYVECWDELS